MRNALHHHELLIGMRQFFKERSQILETGNAVVLASQNQSRHIDFFRIANG